MTRSERLRLALDWKQPAMARFLGVNQSKVSRMEQSGTEHGPVARLLDQLEAALACDRLDLPVTPEQALAVLMPGKGDASSVAAE